MADTAVEHTASPARAHGATFRTTRHSTMGSHIHVRYSGGGWAIFRAEEVSPVSTHRILEDAVHIAREIAARESCALTIHDREGRTRSTEFPVSGDAS